MTIWSLTTDTDNGLSTDLYLTEHDAYAALIRAWFPSHEKQGHPDHADYAASHAALNEGIPEVGVSAIYTWFSSYIDRSGDCDSFIVTRHDHPWIFIG